MKETKQHILNTLAYFDIFHYPLLIEEIQRFHENIATLSLIEEAINSLLTEERIFKIDEFYAIQNNKLLAERRRQGNQLAARQMPTAKRSAKILSRFPYVKGLAISGSLSKNFCTESTDIDFFIITTANRLWIARTMMHLYKKFTFLTGRQKWFCMNYYIDEAGMEIIEKNIFTAMEISTLLPMHGKAVLENLMLNNLWVKNYFPAAGVNATRVPEIKKGFICKFAEYIFNTRVGNWLDDVLMKITRKRWEKKEIKKRKNDHGFVMGMMVSKHYSKPNPVFFQNKVLALHKAKLDALIQSADNNAINT